MFSYLTSQLVEAQQRELRAQRRPARSAGLVTASRRTSAPRRSVRWAFRKVLWLRSQPQR